MSSFLPFAPLVRTISTDVTTEVVAPLQVQTTANTSQIAVLNTKVETFRGPIGPAGPAGPLGPVGPAGDDGLNVLNGTVDPTGGDGVDGEFWINTTSNTIFGPKASGTWPAGVSITGPPGVGGAVVKANTYSESYTGDNIFSIGATGTISFNTAFPGPALPVVTATLQNSGNNSCYPLCIENEQLGSFDYKINQLESTHNAVLVEGIDSINPTATVTELSVHLLPNGNPAVAYLNGTNPDYGLWYSFSSTASGSLVTDWSTPIQIHAGNQVGRSPSLRIVNGRPAIAYYVGTGTRGLMYLRANDATGSAWPVAPATPNVDVGSGVGQSCSLQVVNGNPAIAYQHNSNPYGLHYIRATDVDGATWPAPLTSPNIDTSFTGQYANLQIVNGRPAITWFRSSAPSGLHYVRANDVDGTSWPAIIGVHIAGSTGSYPSLRIVNGRPAISYHRSSVGLQYIRANDVDGATWPAPPPPIHSGSSVGFPAVLQVVGGKPMIAYYYGANPTSFRVIKSVDIDGTSWDPSIILKDGSNVGPNPDFIVLSSGSPAGFFRNGNSSSIAYFAANAAQLKIGWHATELNDP